MIVFCKYNHNKSIFKFSPVFSNITIETFFQGNEKFRGCCGEVYDKNH